MLVMQNVVMRLCGMVNFYFVCVLLCAGGSIVCFAAHNWNNSITPWYAGCKILGHVFQCAEDSGAEGASIARHKPVLKGRGQVRLKAMGGMVTQAPVRPCNKMDKAQKRPGVST